MDKNIPLSYELHAHTQAHAHTHKRTAERNELAEPQRRGIATHTHAHKHSHTLTQIYRYAQKRAAGINKKAEPDPSAAVYPALFLKGKTSTMQLKKQAILQMGSQFMVQALDQVT